MPQVTIQTLPGLPLVQPGDDLAGLIAAALETADVRPRDGDVYVVAQKIVSKAEGRQVRLDSVTPGQRATELAAATDKDPRLVQLILDESTDVLRAKPGVIIVRHRLGLVGANAGIDQSNIEIGDAESALLLPLDPDASAARLREKLEALTGARCGVIVGDSHNRPWRMGTIGCAIGCAGLQVLDDRRGGEDMFGRELKVTMINRADSIAATATLLMGETDEGTPVALVSGLAPDPVAGSAAEIPRPLDEDLFR